MIRKIVSLSLLVCFFFPLSTSAKWDDRSDELPGTQDNSTTIILLAVGGAVLVGLGVYALKTKSSYVEQKDTGWQSQIRIKPVFDLKFDSAANLKKYNYGILNQAVNVGVKIDF